MVLLKVNHAFFYSAKKMVYKKTLIEIRINFENVMFKNSK